MHRRDLRPYVLLAVATAAPGAASAACGSLLEADFWASAAAADVAACVAAGGMVDARDDDGRTPLHLAAESAPDAASLRALLDAGANVSAIDVDERTPLHAAADSAASADIVASLALWGAEIDPRMGEDQCRSPVTVCAPTPLHRAAARGDEATGIAVALLALGADPDAQDHEGQRPLHFAAKVSGEDMVAALLRAGAGPDAQDFESWTPLHRAVARADAAPAVVAALLAAEASADAENFEGTTPLHMAAVYATEIRIVEQVAQASEAPCAADEKGRDFFSLYDLNEALERGPLYWRLHQQCRGE